MSDLGPGRTAVQLSELHEAANLTGAVRRVAADRDALLPSGAAYAPLAEQLAQWLDWLAAAALASAMQRSRVSTTATAAVM